MRRKKQTPEQNVRQVRPQQSANVFSYYANRVPSGDEQRVRRGPEPSTVSRSYRLKIAPPQSWLSFIPTFITSIAIVVCLFYVSSLSSNAKLQIIGDAKIGLAHEVAEYESGIRKILDNSIENKSKLLINTDKIANQISDSFPELGDVSVILPLVGRRPVVQVQPAAPSIVLTTVEGGFVLDSNGRAMTKAADLESSVRDTLPVVNDESGLSLELGRYAMSKESVTFVQGVAEQLKRKNIQVQTMTLPAIANELHVRITGAPYFIKFNLRGEGRVQAGTYIAIHKKLAQDNIVPRQYIDVRVPGKAYYK